MSEDECERCESDRGHLNWEIIWVDDKPFCPYTLTRVWTEEESEEWSEEQWKEVESEELEIVRSASYKVIKRNSKVIKP